jgi:hypothetical protein
MTGTIIYFEASKVTIFVAKKNLLNSSSCQTKQVKKISDGDDTYQHRQLSDSSYCNPD